MKPLSRKRGSIYLTLLLVLAAAACSPERKDWRAANAHPSTSTFIEFLTKYPNSRLVEAAKQKLEACQFDDTVALNTVDGYQRFLTQYPASTFTDKARQTMDALDWADAQKKGTARAWQEFVESHAASPHAAEAKARLESILGSRPAETRAVQTVGVIVRLTFSEDVKDVNIGFDNVLEEFFPYIGVRRAQKDAQADATIVIASEAEALGENYAPLGIPYGGTTLYTGATVTGTIAVEMGGKRMLAGSFHGEVPCPSTTPQGSHPNPSDAPFGEAMENGFPPEAALILARAFGFRPMIDALGSGSDRVASAAVYALERGGESAQSFLAEALTRTDAAVQARAAEALGGHKNPAAVALLVTCLEKEGPADAPLREAAARSLSKLGAIAVPSLEVCCKDTRDSVRAAAARALAGIRTAKSLALLVPLLDDPVKPVRLAAIDAVGEHRDLPAINILIDRLAGPAEESREAVLAAIGKSASPEGDSSGQEETVPGFSWTGGLVTRLVHIMPLLAARPPQLETLCDILSRIGEPSVAPLIQALKSDNVAVRSRAAELLGRISNDQALPALAAASTDPDKSVRLAVAKSLPSFGDTRAIQPLSRLLLDQEPDIRAKALAGLKSVVAAADAAAECRRSLSSPEALKALVTAMDVTDPARVADRDAASEILGAVGKAAVDMLTGCLKSPNRLLREGAVNALGATKDERAVTALLGLAAEPGVQADNDMMARVYSALGATKNRQALDVLTQGLAKDKDAGRRSAAATALGELGDVRAVDALIAALGPDKSSPATPIVEAIEKLTDFTPEDSDFDWKAWWAQNRTRFGLRLP